MNYNDLEKIKEKFAQEYFYKLSDLTMLIIDMEFGGLLVGGRNQEILDKIPDQFENIKIKKQIIDIIAQ